MERDGFIEYMHGRLRKMGVTLVDDRRLKSFKRISRHVWLVETEDGKKTSIMILEEMG